MTTKLYSEVSQETIDQLKGKGYTSVELVLVVPAYPNVLFRVRRFQLSLE